MTSLGFVLGLATFAACTDAPPEEACGPARLYRVDHVDLPVRSGEGASVGLDLNGDGNVDNQLGAMISAARSANPDIPDPTARVNALIATDDQALLLSVSTCADGTTHVELGHSGSGDEIPLTMFVDPAGSYAPIAWLRPDLVRAQLAIDDAAGTAVGRVGFALPVPAALHAVAAPFAAYLTSELRAGTSPVAADADTDHDGVVTPEELLATSWMKVMIAPDLTIEGPHGQEDALSGGIGVRATLLPGQ